MIDFWRRLSQRKLARWTLAHVATAFALLQGIDIVAQRFGRPALCRPLGDDGFECGTRSPGN